MDNISSVMNILISNSGLSECELSRRIDLTVATINKIKTGALSNPTAKTLEKIAQFFEITIDQLLGLSPLETFFTGNLFCIPYIPFDMLSSINDNGLNIHNHQEWKRIEINSDLKHHQLFATKSDSDAMYPLLDKNTLIIVDKDQKIQNKSLVLVRLHKLGEVIVRRLLIDGPFKILKSLNNSFPDISLSEKDQVIGIIIATITDHICN